ncbi:MAG: carboxypeptidase regulatory-like domain-containing protein [Chitinophagaceae bacterium]|nr:carboxypeptidase regulatory-like domain-containing protein [Chitinophagaceae bacterium]
MKNFIRHTTVILFLLGCFACKKEPGYGGLATITGRVYVYDYNPSNVLEAEGYTGDVSVFLKADDFPGVLDDVNTDYNGYYRFDGLRKGKYTIWVFEDCDTCTDNKRVVKQSFEVTQQKAEISLPDFKIKI